MLFRSPIAPRLVKVLSMFTGEEVERMVCGMPEVDIDLLEVRQVHHRDLHRSRLIPVSPFGSRWKTGENERKGAIVESL